MHLGVLRRVHEHFPFTDAVVVDCGQEATGLISIPFPADLTYPNTEMISQFRPTT